MNFVTDQFKSHQQQRLDRLSQQTKAILNGTPLDPYATQYLDMCVDMCVDMCLDMRVDMCMEMCSEMSLDMCLDMCLEIMHVGCRVRGTHWACV